MRTHIIVLSMAAAWAAGCTIETGTRASGPSEPPATAPAASTSGQAAAAPAAPPAAAPATYTDSQGTRVRLEAGAAAFADRVVMFGEGSPVSKFDVNREPSEALGAPDWDEEAKTGYVTLGCGGALTLAFDDVLLREQPGPDLHVFEVGDDVEAVLVEISTDGTQWTRVTVIEGQPASVDISQVATPGARYGFVRLTDQKDACSSRWPGADIDAVAVIGR